MATHSFIQGVFRIQQGLIHKGSASPPCLKPGDLHCIPVEASDESAVRDLFERDPFIVQDILHLAGVHEWLVFLDARKKKA